MNTTTDGSVFNDVNKLNEQIYKLLQENCIEYNNNSLANKNFLSCKECQNLNIEAKICQNCKLPICFFCHKKHLCKNKNKIKENMIIDEKTIEKIKELNFSCINKCQKKMKFDEAIEHYGKCQKDGIQIKDIENKKKIKKTNKSPKKDWGNKVENKFKDKKNIKTPNNKNQSNQFITTNKHDIVGLSDANKLQGITNKVEKTNHTINE